MKTIKMVIMVMVALAMVVSFAGLASASYSNTVCTVLNTRVDNAGVVLIQLERISDSRTRWFKVPDGQENKMLAVALTASSMGSSVYARVDFTVGLSIISFIQLAPYM